MLTLAGAVSSELELLSLLKLPRLPADVRLDSLLVRGEVNGGAGGGGGGVDDCSVGTCCTGGEESTGGVGEDAGDGPNGADGTGGVELQQIIMMDEEI